MQRFHAYLREFSAFTDDDLFQVYLHVYQTIIALGIWPKLELLMYTNPRQNLAAMPTPDDRSDHVNSKRFVARCRLSSQNEIHVRLSQAPLQVT
jgi:hypothetical protein